MIMVKWLVPILLISANFCAAEVIYFSRDLSPERVSWARQLAEEVTEVTGVEISVKPLPFWGVRGEPWLVLSPRLFLRPLASDVSFEVISAENWIGAWLQATIGIRWLAPGESERTYQSMTWAPFRTWRKSQELLPETGTMRFLRRSMLGMPRYWTSLNGITSPEADWSHMLHNIIRSEHFDSHPELFAKDANNLPKRPPFSDSSPYNDQPDLLEPLVEDWVVNAAIKTLNERPYRQDFSVMPNDSYVFSSIPETFSYLQPTGHFGGWLDYSNYVYDFANRVAARVSQIHPNRFVRCDPYMLWLNAPSFPVHPNITVSTADDRTQWYDATFKERDLDLIDRWLVAGPKRQGAIDYIFSEGFFIPRSLTQIVSETIPTFYRRGLRAYVSFVGSNWAYDAHTNWLAAQLLWDVTRDPEELLEEFFSLYYGPAAAPMRAFFDLAEEAWMTQGGTARWLKYWRNPNQVELLLRDPERMPAMEAQLIKAEEVSRGDAEDHRFARRVGYTRSMWEVTKALVALQEARWAYTLKGARFSHRGTEGSERLGKLQKIGERIGELEEEIVERLDAMVASDPRFSNLRQRDWLFQEDPRVRKYEGRSMNYEGGRMNRKEDDPSEKLLLSGFGDFERRWRVSNVDWKGALIEKRGPVVYAENVARGQVATAVPVEVGRTYRLDVGFRGKLSSAAFVHVRADFYDEGRDLIESTKWDRLPPGDYDQPILLGPVATAPEGSSFMRVFIRLFEMEPGDWLEIGDQAVWELAGADK